MTRRTLTLILLTITALMAACGDDSDARPVASTTTQAAAPTPEEAFAADLRATFNDSPDFDTFTADSLTLMQQTCTDLTDLPAAIAEDDAANDSAETDAAIAGASQSITLSLVTDQFAVEEEGLVLLEIAGRHLCPEHAITINEFTAGRRNG